MSYIVIDINSDLESTVYEINTDAEIATAKVALRDAGLAYEYVWADDGADAVLTQQKLFAEGQKHYAAIGDDGLRPVVWGLGHTVEEALADAMDNGVIVERFEQVSAEFAANVEAGDPSWDESAVIETSHEDR
jgi:hypothetical protein